MLLTTLRPPTSKTQRIISNDFRIGILYKLELVIMKFGPNKNWNNRVITVGRYQ